MTIEKAYEIMVEIDKRRDATKEPKLFFHVERVILDEVLFGIELAAARAE